MGWSEQDLIDYERRIPAERKPNYEADRVYRVTRANKARTLAHFANNPEAVKAFNEMTGQEAIAMAKLGRERLRASGALRIPKGMNKTEMRYQQHLELQKRAGAVIWYKFEGVTLKLADDCRLTLDFAVLTAGGILELHDVKASWNRRTAHVEDDALAKMKVAAETFPFVIKVVYLINEKWQEKIL